MTLRHLTRAAAATLALTAGLLAGAAPCFAAVLPAGTQVSGLYDGGATPLLSLDSGYQAAGAASLSDAFGDAEFLSADFGLLVDLGSDGQLRLADNGGGGLAGSHSLRLSFAALPLPLRAVAVADASELLSGQLLVLRPDGATVELHFADLQFVSPFGGVTLQLATVPEPASLALLAAAALAAGAARRRHTARG